MSAEVSQIGRLADLRTDKGMTQQELADATGLTKTNIHRLEHGQKASLLTLKKLANGLEINSSELMYLMEQPSRPKSGAVALATR